MKLSKEEFVAALCLDEYPKSVEVLFNYLTGMYDHNDAAFLPLSFPCLLNKAEQQKRIRMIKEAIEL